MRQTLLSLLLLAVAASPAFADPPDEDVLRPRLEGSLGLFVEFDPGLNITLLDGNPYVRPLLTSYEQETSIYRSALGAAPYVGLSVGYEFSSHIGITLHAAYDARHTSNSGTMIDTCVLADPVSGGEIRSLMQVRKNYRVNADYFSISLLPNYRFERLFFFLGPTISVPIGSTIEETNTIVDEDTPCYYLPQTDDTAKSITGTITGVGNVKTRFSLKMGLGYIFNVAPRVDIVPQLALDLGLDDLLKNDDLLRMRNTTRSEGTSLDIPVNSRMRMNSLQAMIGIRVHL